MADFSFPKSGGGANWGGGVNKDEYGILTTHFDSDANIPFTQEVEFKAKSIEPSPTTDVTSPSLTAASTSANNPSNVNKEVPQTKKEPKEIGYEIEARKGTIEVRLEKLDTIQLMPSTMTTATATSATTTTTKKEEPMDIPSELEDGNKKVGSKKTTVASQSKDFDQERMQKESTATTTALKSAASSFVSGGDDVKKSPKRKNSGCVDNDGKAKKGRRDEEETAAAAALSSSGGATAVAASTTKTPKMKKAEKTKRKTDEARGGSVGGDGSVGVSGGASVSSSAGDVLANSGGARKKLKTVTSTGKDSGKTKVQLVSLRSFRDHC